MEKNYFLVLDDVWNEEQEKWFCLKNLLIGGARGSRIVVTTRSTKVADITRTTSMHTLESLVEEKAWSLFVKMAFKGGKEPDNQALVTLGKQIVGKCSGVPLVLRRLN